MYDIIIIGAGPAGLTAAIFAARKNIETFLLTQNIGGQSLLTHKIENYPGYKSINGKDLADNTFEQAKGFGAKLKDGVLVEKIIKEKDFFEVITKGGDRFSSKVVILAIGKKSLPLGVAGEEKLANMGISYCSTSDAKSFKGKTVVVVGGGNAGLAAADDLLPHASKIYVLEFAARITGDELIYNRLKDTGKVDFITDAKVIQIHGDSWVEGVSYLNRKTDKVSLIPCFGVSINVGQTCSTGFLENFVKLNDRREIEIDFENKTSVKGVFACGDATSVPYKQWVIAAGEGAKAALSAYVYLKENP